MLELQNIKNPKDDSEDESQGSPSPLMRQGTSLVSTKKYREVVDKISELEIILGQEIEKTKGMGEEMKQIRNDMLNRTTFQTFKQFEVKVEQLVKELHGKSDLKSEEMLGKQFKKMNNLLMQLRHSLKQHKQAKQQDSLEQQEADLRAALKAESIGNL